MSASRKRTQGFTLVEILIVVVILGILAAIVIPQFTSASEEAKAGSLATQLQAIRSQLELYRAQHHDYPELADMWEALTERTDIAGNVMGEQDDQADFPFGPYLQQEPTNPFTSGSEVLANANGDWQYDEDSGEILAVVEPNMRTQLDLSDNDTVDQPAVVE